jgi:hypothetical protein
VDERLSRLPDEPSAVEVVALLIELPLSGYRRAVDMQIFEFGRRVPFVDRFGHNGTSANSACTFKVIGGFSARESHL